MEHGCSGLELGSICCRPRIQTALPKKDEINPKDNHISFQRTTQKSAKDPNKPKRAPSAFFVFMEDFRKLFKEKNPNNKSVAAVGKAAGEQWKSMSDADKAPYFEKANIRKKEFEKAMAAYLKKQAGGSDSNGDESDKSKSEVNDDAVDGSGLEEQDDD